MTMILIRQELDERRERFVRAMTQAHPEWDTALFVSKVNQYYFTGTMQDAVLLIFRGGEYAYYVRKSCERAEEESPLTVRPMNSYRDIADAGHVQWGRTFVEADSIPYGMVERMRKYCHMDSVFALDAVIGEVRSVKSPYELHWIGTSGRQHDRLLTEVVPGLLKEGMSETELTGEVFLEMLRLNHQGLARFNQYQTEIVAGQLGFGVNSLCPTSFDGPGGASGICAAAPVAGSPDRKLQKGDLVFVDIGFGMNGYHSDKTQVYQFGGKPAPETLAAHRMCMDVLLRAADMLKPGAIPSEIYRAALSTLSADQLRNFMGYGSRAVKFLGHGVGLHIDELPVIAEGFSAPLRENTVISLEPKKGVPGVGMVGVEETFLVTPGGGKCLTGGPREIIMV